jgi:hypothetical protein
VKSVIVSVLLAAAWGICAAADAGPSPSADGFEVERMPFGSGTPAATATLGTENARHVADGLYHVPNYLPGFPTAATIWPREIPIECEPDPATGRGEYIFIRPVAKMTPPPPSPPVVEVICQCCRCADPAPPPEQPLPKARKKPLG